ncbi:MAG TPA: hypothetical protein VKR79_08005 [Gaiellaceae bacterium]|nr:hypothetical protein [Gaiellaceae bacterium]
MRKLLIGMLLFGLGLGGAVLVTSPGAGARTLDGTLTGGVSAGNPSASLITLSASSVAAGTYTFDITDSAPTHDFELLNPSGVSVDNTGNSDAAMEGSFTWTVTLTPGTWHYRCHFHTGSMTKTLTVTGGTTSTSTTTMTTSTTTQTTTTGTTATTATTATTGTTATTATTDTGTTDTTTTDTTTTDTTPTTTDTTPTTTTAPTTTSGGGGGGLHVRIVSVHATSKLVKVTAASNQLTRVTAVLLHKGKKVASAAADGKKVKLSLKPRQALAPGSYTLKVKVACCGTSATATKTIKIP